MGGEWSLAVALVMECWPERHRPKLAGVIGAAANVGFLLIALMALCRQVTQSDWRWMMLVGAAPALLALFITFWVPESQRWQSGRQAGRPQPGDRNLPPRTPEQDPAGHGLLRHSPDRHLGSRLRLDAHVGRPIAGSTNGQRICSAVTGAELREGEDPQQRQAVLEKSLSAEQWREIRDATAPPRYTCRSSSASAAIIGCLVAPLVSSIFGRRPVYFGLCLLSLLSCGWLYLGCTSYNAWFVIAAGIAGCMTAAFYGWLPLYLPELFPTRVCATGQGLSFNAGRVVAAAGSLFMGQFVALCGNHYGHAAALICLAYVLGLVLIWFAPETSGKPLLD